MGVEDISMEQKATGIMRGNAIELDYPLAMANGQAVEIVVRPIAEPRSWGKGILKSAGGWAEYPEMDEVMQRIHAERKLERRSVPSP
jgi:hypothetical protein